MRYIQPDFHTILYKEVLDMCLLQFEDVYNCNGHVISMNYVNSLMKHAMCLYIVPRRSYKQYIIKLNVNIITNKINTYNPP